MTCPIPDDDALGGHPGSFLVEATAVRGFLRDALYVEPADSPQRLTLERMLTALDEHGTVLVRLVPLDLGPETTALDLLEAELAGLPEQNN